MASAQRTTAAPAKKAAPTYTPQYGDTQGAELYLDKVSISAGANRLISDGACVCMYLYVCMPCVLLPPPIAIL